MATVYLVVAQGPGGFNKLQVVKLLHPQLAGDAEFVDMFLQEARLVARLNHPNVVQTYDVGYDGKSFGIVMEYLDGQSFEHILRRGDKLAKTEGEGAKMSIPAQLRIMTEMLQGLGYAHDLTDFSGTPLNIVHRDVTPHNVIVTYDGHVKLVDFGIAKAADSNGQTRAGVIKGKIAYMAPEQFGGQKIDRRADLFAVGIMLWQIATGQRLWRGLSETDIFKKLAAKQIPSPRAVEPTVPEELEAICLRALQYHPDDRFQTAAEFQRALDDYVSKTERCTPQQLGAWVSRTFADQRARIKTTVEQRLKVPAAPVAGPLAATSAPDLAVTSGQFLLPKVSADRGVEVVAPTPTADTLGWKVAIPSLGLLVVAGLGFFAMRRTPEKLAPAAPAEVTVEADRRATLTIEVTPPYAKVYLDDMPSSKSRVVERDGLSHRVRAEALGFSSAGQLVVFDSSLVNVALSLEPDKPNAAPSASSAPTPPPPPAAPRPVATAPAPAAQPAPAPRPQQAVAPTEPTNRSPTLDTSENPWRK